MTSPLISVVIVNFNGLKWLNGSLQSIQDQKYPNFEVILVDNNSSDNSIKYVSKHFPSVNIIASSKNVGFAEGNNIGVSHAHGEYIVLLNSDTQVPIDFLTIFYESFRAIPNLAIAQPKILMLHNHNRIDSCGSFWTRSTWQNYLGNGKSINNPLYEISQPVFSVKGAGVMVKRSVIDKIGLFDNDFWCYYEETDFCHRAWIAGYECWYLPKAYIYHAVGGTSTTFPNSYIQFHNYKNKLQSFIKNFETSSLPFVLFMFIAWSAAISTMWVCLGKFDLLQALLKAYLWNIKRISKTISKRKVIQESRTRSDNDIFKEVKKEPRLVYYYYLLIGRLDLCPD